jgi:hypothetical protein
LPYIVNRNIRDLIFREQVQGKETSWLSKYEEKKPSEKLWDAIWRVQDISQEMDMKPMNAEVILLAGWQ